MRTRVWLTLGCCLGCGDADPDEKTPRDTLPLGEVPPAPAASCDAPPAPVTLQIQAQLGAWQADTVAVSAAALDPTKVTVVTCGTGSPFPGDRAQSCTAVFANGQFLLFDAGDRAEPAMEAQGLPVAELSAVFLTHYHSDHIADLGEVISRSWILGRHHPLSVYGGTAVERVVEGFNAAYALDVNYREAHHGTALMPGQSAAATPVVIEAPGAEGALVYDHDGVQVHAYAVDHSPIEPALGYRVTYGGRTVAISGDTIDTPGLRALARGADVLVSEVMSKPFAEDIECMLGTLGDERNATLFRDIRTYHIDATEVGAVAADAGVDTVVLTHQVPVVQDPAHAQALYLDPIAASFGGEVIVPTDGTQVVLPVGG